MLCGHLLLTLCSAEVDKASKAIRSISQALNLTDAEYLEMVVEAVNGID
jgi:hypothetical protein